MADRAPAPGRRVFDDVMVFAVRRQAGQAGDPGSGERGGVVSVAVPGGPVAAGPGADRIPGEQGLAHQGAGVMAGGGRFQDGAVHRVGQQPPPGAVVGDTASHLGGDGAIAGELGGVLVQAEEGVGGDDDFDVGSPSVLVGESRPSQSSPLRRMCSNRSAVTSARRCSAVRSSLTRAAFWAAVGASDVGLVSAVSED